MHDVEHLFICLFLLCISSLMRCLFISMSHLWLCCELSLAEFWGFFCCCSIIVLYQMCKRANILNFTHFSWTWCHRLKCYLWNFGGDLFYCIANPATIINLFIPAISHFKDNELQGKSARSFLIKIRKSFLGHLFPSLFIHPLSLDVSIWIYGS